VRRRILRKPEGDEVLVQASILIDAPAEDVFAILTDYGSDVRRRINPQLKVQTVVERAGNVVICENEWDSGGRTVRQRRRYTIFPPGRIEEDVLGVDRGMVHVTTRVETDGDQTQLTLISDYRFGGIWRFLGGFAADKLREADEGILATLKAGIEAEFEDVEEG
jgi:hypothetical protein